LLVKLNAASAIDWLRAAVDGSHVVPFGGRGSRNDVTQLILLLNDLRARPVGGKVGRPRQKPDVVLAESRSRPRQVPPVALAARPPRHRARLRTLPLRRGRRRPL
jgi:hypothetical protein